MYSKPFENSIAPHTTEYRYNHCILQYVDFDEQQEMQRWSDIHPLIRGIQEFKKELEKTQNLSSN